MRYGDIPPVDFVNVFGQEKNIFNMYRGEVGVSNNFRPKPAEMDLDLMYVTLFGGSAGDSHVLRDLNVAALLDYDFNEAKLRRVRVS